MLSPLALALPAMTALQATVALGIFALSVLAPQLGLSVPQLAALNTLLFSVGALSALMAGRLLRRLGEWNVAAWCAAAVAAGMLCLLIDARPGGSSGGPSAGSWAPWVAVVCFGLAFGPETPASASVLTRITPAAQRSWVFSVRQTGNQIGAMAGSVLLPLLLVWHPQLPFVAVALVAAAMAAWCLVLSHDARTAHVPGQTGGAGIELAALRHILGSRPLCALAIAALIYTAVQMCLNTFLMSLFVRDWRLDIPVAAAWLAWLQAAGLGGRLFWGWAAQGVRNAAHLLGLIGLLIAASGIMLMAWPAARGSTLVQGLLVFLLGFSASGWNGVLVAEVSRIAGNRDAGALTGAVLMFGYGGLTLAPLVFAGASGAASMASAFIALFAAAGLAAAALLLTPRPAA